MSYDHNDRNQRNRSNGDTSGPVDGIHPAVEILSEYLDQDSGLAQAERDAIDRHLEGCEHCRQTLAELQLMVSTLGSLPEARAPRSFALRPELLEPAKKPERPAPVVLQESSQWYERHAGKVRWATAVAAMLFVFVISADLLTYNFTGSDDMATGGGDDDMEVMMATEATPADASTESEAAAEEAAPDARLQEDEVPASERESTDGAGSDEAVPESDSSTSDDSTAAEEEEAETMTSLVPSEEADSSDSADDAPLAMEQEAVSDEPTSESQSAGDSGQTRWRIAQVSLALILAVLLTVMIGLPRQRGRRR